MSLLRTRRPTPPVPSVVSFDITYRCNLKCEMCPVWPLAGADDVESELSTAEICEAAKRLHTEFGVGHFRFLGGEPFVRPDLAEIVRNVSPYATTEVTTNGVLLDPERARDIVAAGIHQINISLDGPRENCEALRGPDVYETVTGNLRALVDLVSNGNGRRPGIKLGNIVTRLNYRRLEEVMLLARELGVDWHFWLMHDVPGHVGETSWAGVHCGFPRPMPSDTQRLMLDDAEKPVYWAEFYRLRRIYGGPQHFKAGLPDRLQWIEPYLHPLFYSMGRLVYRDCNRVRSHMIVGPGGEVIACEFLRSVRLGNVKGRQGNPWLTAERETFRKVVGDGELASCRKCNRLGLYRGKAL